MDVRIWGKDGFLQSQQWTGFNNNGELRKTNDIDDDDDDNNKTYYYYYYCNFYIIRCPNVLFK
jgi:hypothetical protein